MRHFIQLWDLSFFSCAAAALRFLGVENKGFAVRALTYCRILLVCAYANFVKRAVFAALRVVCALLNCT